MFMCLNIFDEKWLNNFIWFKLNCLKSGAVISSDMSFEPKAVLLLVSKHISTIPLTCGFWC